MTDTFDPTWVPLVGPSGEGTLRSRVAQFGDGYVQETADGINTTLETWPLVWLGVGADIAPIRDFLKAHVGQRFYWTPPLGVQGYYACPDKYVLVPLGGGNYQLSATFVERAAP